MERVVLLASRELLILSFFLKSFFLVFVLLFQSHQNYLKLVWYFKEVWVRLFLVCHFSCIVKILSIMILHRVSIFSSNKGFHIKLLYLSVFFCIWLLVVVTSYVSFIFLQQMSISVCPLAYNVFDEITNTSVAPPKQLCDMIL